jgi:phosphotransferase system enzyme I (PtsI)
MLHGLPVSPGVAVGRAVVFRFGGLRAFRRAMSAEELPREEGRLREAAAKAAASFQEQARRVSGEVGSEIAAILEAHGLIAVDETYLGAIVEHMRGDRVNAEWALAAVTGQFARRLAEAAMRERGADLADVAREISVHLSGAVVFEPHDLPRGSILVADELSPLDASRLDPRRVRAIALEGGGPTSHASIIFRSFGLPAVVGVPDLCNAVSPERPIVVDGDRGSVDVTPSKEKLRKSLLRESEERERSRRLRARTSRGASTRDGVRVIVRANLELAEELPALERYHAEGVGLFRSEFVYLQAAPRQPSVLEQQAVYELLLEAAKGQPVVVRTYDLGGEKGIGPARGENPALGLRGLRYCLAHPDLFDAQLSALCLASRGGDLRILLPMVSSLGELREARRRLVKASDAAGLPRPPALGVMVEVPAAALMADRIAPETDFFSIGTNDLAQYALAVDRADPEVSALYRPLHPAILRMIKFVVEAGRAHERPVAVCGELAADPVGIAVLVGLGLTEFSVTPVSIATVRDHLANLDAAKVKALAEKALDAADAAEVERIFFRGRM